MPQRKSARPRKNTLTKFQRFGLFFYDRPRLVFTAWLFILGFGVLSYTTLMQRQGFPNVEVPVSIVNAGYFVSDREQVDNEVAKPLAKVIDDVEGVKDVTTTSTDNFATVVVEYEEGISSQKGSSRVEAAVKKSQKLPATAQVLYQPINAAKFDGENDMLVSVYKPGVTQVSELHDQAVQLAESLGSVSGVKNAQVVESYKSGTNPLTGESTTVQTNFDRLGLREGDQTNFFATLNVGVAFEKDADILKVSEAVNEKLEAIADDEPFRNIKAHVSADFAPSIEEQVASLQRSLLEGLIVVIIISFLLISWRAGLATSLSMVSVLILTITILYLVGITLNTISLFALILCLGLIVDDTTIMVEAVDALKAGRKDRRTIAATALKRVARASTAGTLTTMLAFAPMLFIGGILGSFIRVLPITIIISLAVSLFVSLTLIPFFARFLLLSGKRTAKKRQSFVARIEEAISSRLANLVRVGQRSRRKGIAVGLLAIFFSFGVVMASGYYFSKLKFDIFPVQKEANDLVLNLAFAPGTTITEAQTITDEANNRIATALGDNLRQIAYYNTGTDTSASGSILLVPYDERDPSATDLANAARESLTGLKGVEAKLSVAGAGPPASDLPFAMQISGEDEAKTRQLAEVIAADLKGQKLKRPNGTPVTINKTEVSSSFTILRKNGQRFVQINAGFDATDTSALVTLAQDYVEKTYPPARLESEFDVSGEALAFDFGDESDNQESFASMVLAFPVLLLVMYVMLAFLFRSLLQPLLIFMAIPFSFFGVGLGLYLTDNALSFFVMLGFFALIGIAVNNTILLTDYANQAHKAGAGRIEAVAEALQARFRPLLATSLTSIFALIPLALNDPFWQALSVTLIFGLLSSTLLVIIAFPYYLLAGETIRAGGRRAWRTVRRR